jgi:hypothetical protein
LPPPSDRNPRRGRRPPCRWTTQQRPSTSR